LRLQIAALIKIRSEILADHGTIFITENFYESIFGYDLPGRIIFLLTKLTWPSTIFRWFGANTAGEGVRFRSFEAWSSIFKKSGFNIYSCFIKKKWYMPLWQKIPFLCKHRYQALVTLRKAD